MTLQFQYTPVSLTATHKKSSSTFEYVNGSVEIGNNVWLGAHAVVLNNSNVKLGSIIGAGCVFKGISEEYSIYIGNPAKLNGSRQLDDKYELDYKPYFR